MFPLLLIFFLIYPISKNTDNKINTKNKNYTYNTFKLFESSSMTLGSWKKERKVERITLRNIKTINIKINQKIPDRRKEKTDHTAAYF